MYSNETKVNTAADTSGKSVVKTVSNIMIITLIGKVFGLLRDQFFAWNYATGKAASAFLSASRIPRVFFDAVFASAITSCFIPVFNEYLQKKGKKEAFYLASNFLNIIGIITAVITVVGIIFAVPITNFIADGFDAETARLCVSLLRVMFPIMIMTAVAFIFVGILQSMEKFAIPAAISIFSNLVIIFYYIFFNEKYGINGLAITFLIAWGVQAAVQIPSLVKGGFKYKFIVNFKEEGIRKIFVLMVPVMVGTWIQPINLLINTKFASRLYEGAGVSAMDYANTLYTIIVGVIVLAVANVVFPKFSRLATDGNKKEFKDTIRKTLSVLMFFLVPLSVGLICQSTPIVKLLYQWKAFDTFSTHITSNVLMYFALGMVGYAFFTIISRAFYAYQNGKTPLISGVISIAVNIILCMLLVERFEFTGLALASVISQSAAAVILTVSLRKKIGRIFPKGYIYQVLKMVICAVIMGFIVYALRNLISGRVGDGLISRAAIVIIPTVVGVILYCGLTVLFRVPEAKKALEMIKSKLGKGAAYKEEMGFSESFSEKTEENKYSALEKESINYWSQSIIGGFISDIWSGFKKIYFESNLYRCYLAAAKFLWWLIDGSFIIGLFRYNWLKKSSENSSISYGGYSFWAYSGRKLKNSNNAAAVSIRESVILEIFGVKAILFFAGLMVFGLPVLPTMALAALSAVILVLYILNVFLGRIVPRKFDILDWSVFLFGVCYFISSVFSYSKTQNIQTAVLFVVFMSVFFILRNLLNTEKRLNLFIKIFLFSALIVGLYGIYQYVTGNVVMNSAWVDKDSFGDLTIRVYSTFTNPNVFGEYLVVAISVCVGMLWKAKGALGKIYYIFVAGVLMLSLILTSSRGAMLGLLIALCIFIIFSEKRLLILILLGAIAMPFVLPESIWSRLSSVITLSDTSSLYRISIYKACINIIREYWITGIGVGAFPLIYPEFSYSAANAYHAHNLFLNVFIELGFLGFGLLILSAVLFMQNIYYGIKSGIRKYGFLLGGILGGFIGIMMQGMTDYIWHDYRIVLLFWIILGVGMASVNTGVRLNEKAKRNSCNNG